MGTHLKFLPLGTMGTRFKFLPLGTMDPIQTRPGGLRPVVLTKLHYALKSIQPSSVESERCFSTCGIYDTKIRSQLGDETLSALLFLNPIPTSQGRNQPLDERHVTKSGRNRVKTACF